MNKRLVQNAIWNISSNALPLIAGLLAIPFLIRGLGVDRFGVLSIAWVLVGYFSLFDMGLSRALTKLVAEQVGRNASDDISGVVSTALLLMWGLGLIGGLTVWLLSTWLATDLLNIPGKLQLEARDAFRVISLSIPFVIATAGFRGVLEAFQRYGMISVIRTLLGIATFAAPLFVIGFSNDLRLAVGALVIIRLIVCWWHWRLVKTVVASSAKKRWETRWLKALFAFGGWITVSNVIGPLMVNLDRFLIGSMLSIAAVAYYTTPFDVVTKLLVVPAGLAGVLFSAVATNWHRESHKAIQLVERGGVYVLVVLFPMLLLLATFAHELLSYWLTEEFANHGTLVLQWLAAGILVNGVAHLRLALLQAAGYADWAAKLHAIELLPYGLLLWVLLSRYGVAGAAVAWFIRVTVDAAAFSVMAKRLEGPEGILGVLDLASICGAAIILLTVLIESTLHRAVFFAILIFTFAVIVWRWLFGDLERTWFRYILTNRRC